MLSPLFLRSNRLFFAPDMEMRVLFSPVTAATDAVVRDIKSVTVHFASKLPLSQACFSQAGLYILWK